MKRSDRFSRRHFIKVWLAAGIALVIEMDLSGCIATLSRRRSLPGERLQVRQDTSTPPAQATEGTVPSEPEKAFTVQPSLYIQLTNEGLVTVTVPRSEMGQGTRTALAMILAEELCADWSTIRVEQAPADSAYGDQGTHGSTSIQDFYLVFRQAGAVGRELMLRAAAKTWGVEPAQCRAAHNTVTHLASGKQLAYTDLLEPASRLPVPSTQDILLKELQDFTIIGQSMGRVDTPNMIRGSAMYGMDVRLPGLLFASVARSPTLGGTLIQFDATRAGQVPGVVDVIAMECGVAVVAKNTWAAFKGKAALDVIWDEGPNTTLNTEQIEQALVAQANAVPTAGDELTGIYTFPYFAHMPMEPMNCTADVQPDNCEIWVPTQGPQLVKSRAAALTSLSPDQVKVNVTLIGGGFGRRVELSRNGDLPVEADYVSQAVQVSKAVKAPVQVVWTREGIFAMTCFTHSWSLGSARAWMVFRLYK